MKLNNPPRQGIYSLAAKLVFEREEGNNDTSFLANNPEKKRITNLAKLVSENKKGIETILKKTGIVDREKKLPRFLAMVLIAELKWGSKKFHNSDQFHVKLIKRFEKEILSGSSSSGKSESDEEEDLSSKENGSKNSSKTEENTKRSHNKKKLPFIYKAAASVITKTVESKGKDFKGHLYSTVDPRRNIKGVFSLVTKTMKHEKDLDQILEQTKLLEKNRLSPTIARVLITELLWGKKSLPPADTCIPIQIILDNESAIRSVPLTLTDDNDEMLVKPRYVRVNTIFNTVTQVVDDFLAEGYKLVETPLTYSKFVTAIDKLKPKEFLRDYHLPDVLVFHPKTEFYNHPMFSQGILILQDKASCFVPHILNPKENSVVLDMCSAPGLKASHAAALMENKGKIYCVEMDPNRFGTLKEFLKKSGVTIAESQNMDALRLNPKELGDVEYIMLDVPCTGSGMTTRLQDSGSIDEERIKRLQSLQQKLLKFAIKNFPSCKRIVYSTCSVCHEENEDVVMGVMSLAAHQGYSLIDPSSTFKGELPESNVLKHTLCFRHERDRTNGFFLAVLDRSTPQKDIDESDEESIKEEEVSEEEVEEEPPAKGKGRKRPNRPQGAPQTDQQSEKKSKIAAEDSEESNDQEEVSEEEAKEKTPAKGKGRKRPKRSQGASQRGEQSEKKSKLAVKEADEQEESKETEEVEEVEFSVKKGSRKSKTPKKSVGGTPSKKKGTKSPRKSVGK